MDLYALIMAGGEGKRFWPLSRKDKPKQFLSLVSGKSMIRQTVDRVLPIIPIEKIFVVTLERYARETLRHVSELPAENLILEPEGKNTGPAIAVGTLRIKKLSPDALTVVLPADHAIGKEEVFREVILYAAQIANMRLQNNDHPLITLGVKPVRPETGYGYIKEGETIDKSNRFEVKRVERFTEKPDSTTARRFLEQGGYLWNSGIFIWKASSILDAFEKLLPHWSKPLDSLLDDLNTNRENTGLIRFYEQIEPGPIDKLILEKWGNTLVIPVDFPWSDIGSWQALDEFLRKSDGENILRGEAVAVDSTSCLVFGDKRLIAVVGVKGLVVVETDDAILVLDKEKAQDVKKVVEKLEKEGKLKVES
ncbi:MAG TPA: mannose-1-phosphate guanylyltransferase [Thermodesulfobacteriota bacterium]|nr:mannose-1-phosphate guanylyltransferase [Thermodesulfobacteriota bacterium]